MRRTIAIVIAASFAGIILFSGIGQAQGLKLAFVDFEKFAKKSVRYQQMQKKFATLVARKRADLEKKRKEILTLKEQLQKQGPMLKEQTRTAKIKEIGIKEMEFKLAEKGAQNSLQNAQREQMAIFQRDVRKIIGSIRKQHNYSMILNSGALISAGDTFDITDTAAKLYDGAGTAPKPAARPAAKPRPKPAARPAPKRTAPAKNKK